VTYSGREEDMKVIFRQLVEGNKDIKLSGDLKLVEVHCIYK